MRWSSDRFLKAANDALDDLSMVTKFFERYFTIPIKGRQTYYDLRGFIKNCRVTFVYNVDQQIWLTPRHIIDMVQPRWETVTGTPQEYLVRGLYWLGLYPRPDSDTGTVRVYYNGLAPHLVDSSSVIVSDLPDDFVQALDDYMLYDLSAKDGESDKALLHWADYTTRRKGLHGHVKKRLESRAGRISQ